MSHARPFPIGQDFIEEGYTHDSMGLMLDPGAPYEWRGERWQGPEKIWRKGLKEPMECVVLQRPE